jgi:hypothetical protein
MSSIIVRRFASASTHARPLRAVSGESVADEVDVEVGVEVEVEVGGTSAGVIGGAELPPQATTVDATSTMDAMRIQKE